MDSFVNRKIGGDPLGVEESKPSTTNFSVCTINTSQASPGNAIETGDWCTEFYVRGHSVNCVVTLGRNEINRKIARTGPNERNALQWALAEGNGPVGEGDVLDSS